MHRKCKGAYHAQPLHLHNAHALHSAPLHLRCIVHMVQVQKYVVHFICTYGARKKEDAKQPKVQKRNTGKKGN